MNLTLTLFGTTLSLDIGPAYEDESPAYAEPLDLVEDSAPVFDPKVAAFLGTDYDYDDDDDGE